jgi:hypothetical protein
MNPLAKRLGITAAKYLGRIAFDRKYLVGRHFELSTVGWRWVLNGIWFQKVLGFNRRVPWPMSPQSRISDPKSIYFHPDDLNNFQSPGCYFQNFAARIVLGPGTYIGPNVGIITSNHDPTALHQHLDGADVTIGERCWVGMNSVILPGVVLGSGTIVGAGSVVTKSFPEGSCIIAGAPARIIRQLDRDPRRDSESLPPTMQHL